MEPLLFFRAANEAKNQHVAILFVMHFWNNTENLSRLKDKHSEFGFLYLQSLMKERLRFRSAWQVKTIKISPTVFFKNQVDYQRQKAAFR